MNVGLGTRACRFISGNSSIEFSVQCIYGGYMWLKKLAKEQHRCDEVDDCFIAFITLTMIAVGPSSLYADPEAISQIQ